MRFVFIMLLCVILNPIMVYAKSHLIFDHDGGVDDVSALEILYGSHQYQLDAVTIVPADSFKHSASNTTIKFLNKMKAKKIRVAASNEIGTHPFPDEWRKDSDKTDTLLSDEYLKGSITLDQHTPAEVLVDLLSQHKKVTLVLTGSLTNIAEALKLAKKRHIDIIHHVKRAYIMGGAVFTPGNVEQYPEAGEWNFYNNPKAARKVILSGMPITLVGLDASNTLVVKNPIVKGDLPPIELFKQQGKKWYASQFAYQLWSVSPEVINSGIYCFWDTLTAVAALDPGVIQTKRLRIDVETAVPHEGRVVIVNDQHRPGAYVDVAIGVDKVRFRDDLLKFLAY